MNLAGIVVLILPVCCCMLLWVVVGVGAVDGGSEHKGCTKIESKECASPLLQRPLCGIIVCGQGSLVAWP